MKADLDEEFRQTWIRLYMPLRIICGMYERCQKHPIEFALHCCIGEYIPGFTKPAHKISATIR